MREERCPTLLQPETTRFATHLDSVSELVDTLEHESARLGAEQDFLARAGGGGLGKGAHERPGGAGCVGEHFLLTKGLLEYGVDGAIAIAERTGDRGGLAN